MATDEVQPTGGAYRPPTSLWIRELVRRIRCTDGLVLLAEDAVNLAQRPRHGRHIRVLVPERGHGEDEPALLPRPGDWKPGADSKGKGVVDTDCSLATEAVPLRLDGFHEDAGVLAEPGAVVGQVVARSGHDRDARQRLQAGRVKQEEDDRVVVLRGPVECFGQRVWR